MISHFVRETQTWHLDQGRPAIQGIIVYARIDGGFSVWDPARNYWRADPKRPAAYHFSSSQVWDGLDMGGIRVCEGVERDWVNWQEGRKPQFAALEAALKELSPEREPLLPGPPQRLFLGEGWDRPTLRAGDQVVPLALASAGVRRILALAYFLVWVWYEHRATAKLMGKKTEKQFVLLIDEPETHLHPRWQRTLLPSLLATMGKFHEGREGRKGNDPQIIVATHAPLIVASLEPLFDESKDDLMHLQRDESGAVVLRQGQWASQGDVSNWLVSETFGLGQPRSKEAEEAIEAAEAWMRGDREGLPERLGDPDSIHRVLCKVLPAHDAFWPRWIVTRKISLSPGASS
jgi:hypothetical protein